VLVYLASSDHKTEDEVDPFWRHRLTATGRTLGPQTSRRASSDASSVYMRER
jgi:hypothetical protein